MLSATLLLAGIVHPAAFPHPEQLYAVWTRQDGKKGPQSPGMTPGDFEDLKQCASFREAAAAVEMPGLTVGDGARTFPAAGARVSASFLRMLGAAPLLGRAFLPEEETQRVRDVLVLSHDLWRMDFASDPTIIGRVITLNGLNAMVVGILPQDFRFPLKFDVLGVIKQSDAAAGERSEANLRVFVRLKSGVKESQAQSELSALAKRLAAAHPETNQGRDFVLIPLRAQLAEKFAPMLAVAGPDGVVSNKNAPASSIPAVALTMRKRE